MPLFFRPVLTPAEITLLADTARGIWFEYFPGIITKEQVAYMVEKFQSPQALSRQIGEDGYCYFLIEDDGNILGYCGLRPDPDALFLSKLYLRAEARGQGHFSGMLHFAEHFARERGLSLLRLTVNRGNDRAIAVYLRKGFRTVREQDADIGTGYVMDDYVMEKMLPGGAADIRTSIHPAQSGPPPAFVVIFARERTGWLFCRHRARETWEAPGGHIEPGEARLDAARRELWEETGVTDAAFVHTFDYRVERAGTSSFGAVFLAEVRTRGALPESEIAETAIFSGLPDRLTYPAIQPVLWTELQKFL